MADDRLSHQYLYPPEMKGCAAVWLFLAVALLAACASREDFPQEDVAANTARLYYQYLIEGKYDDFVAGMDRHIERSQNDERQLVENAKLYVKRQQDQHQGIKSVSIVSSEADTAQHTAMVFLLMEFVDNNKEQILVPMVERDSLWLMR